MKKELILYNDLSLSDENGQYVRKTAITESYSGRTINYGQLNEAIERTAITLRTKFGLNEGDLIMVVSHKRIEDVILFYAAVTAGLSYVPADPKLGKDKFAYLVEQVQPKLIFDTRKKESSIFAEYHDNNLFLDGEANPHIQCNTLTKRETD